MMKQIFTALVILFLVVLAACTQATTWPSGGEVTAVTTPTHPPEHPVETSYALLARDELIETADAIFVGRVTAISPTQFNQDSGDYWEVTTEEADGRETMQTALPVFTVELTVDEVWVDEVGLGETAVLTQVGSSPLEENSDWSLQVGDEIIAFVVQREIAWRDESGRRGVLRFANAPADTYLLRGDDGRYASLPQAADRWLPMTEAEVAQRLAQIRPVLMEDGVSLRITTPEPSPTPAVCTPLPEGMTLTVTPLTDTQISLELSGLQPGETLHIIYRWEDFENTSQIESYGMPPVGEDGRYSETIEPQLTGEGPYTWHIKVIHGRGVACTEITLPPEETAANATTEPWQTFRSQEYGFSVQVPPGWTPVDSLPNQVSFVKQGTGIALRFGVMGAAEDINLVPTGVSAGDFVAREPVLFLGETIHSNALVYQDKVKAVLYENGGEIPRSDLIFVLTLGKNSSDYEAIDIPPDVQAEADAMVESAKLVPDE